MNQYEQEVILNSPLKLDNYQCDLLIIYDIEYLTDQVFEVYYNNKLAHRRVGSFQQRFPIFIFVLLMPYNEINFKGNVKLKCLKIFYTDKFRMYLSNKLMRQATNDDEIKSFNDNPDLSVQIIQNTEFLTINYIPFSYICFDKKINLGQAYDLWRFSKIDIDGEKRHLHQQNLSLLYLDERLFSDICVQMMKFNKESDEKIQEYQGKIQNILNQVGQQIKDFKNDVDQWYLCPIVFQFGCVDILCELV